MKNLSLPCILRLSLTGLLFTSAPANSSEIGLANELSADSDTEIECQLRPNDSSRIDLNAVAKNFLSQNRGRFEDALKKKACPRTIDDSSLIKFSTVGIQRKIEFVPEQFGGRPLENYSEKGSARYMICKYDVIDSESHERTELSGPVVYYAWKVSCLISKK